MKRQRLILILAIFCSTAKFAGAQPAMDTFIIGAYHVSCTNEALNPNSYFQDSYQHYDDDDFAALHFNVIGDYFDPPYEHNLNTAANLGCWFIGTRVPFQIYTPPSYWGVQGLGSNTEAGRYYASLTSPKIQCFSSGSTGNDNEVFIAGEGNVWVRYADQDEGHPAGDMIYNLEDRGMFYFVPEGGTNFRMRLYARRTENPGGNPEALHVYVSWFDGQTPAQEHFATWNGSGYGVFTSNDLDDDWSFTPYKTFYVYNGGGDNTFNAEEICIYWTGNCDMEIYQVIISNGLGDNMVFSNIYDDDIVNAVGAYCDYPAMLRFWTTDEPTWAQIWANDYLNQEISAAPNNPLPWTTGQYRDRLSDEDCLNLWATVIEQNPELYTFEHVIIGNASETKAIPNPYESGVTFSAYDAQLNNNPQTGLGKLESYLTVLVWNALDLRPGTHFWFIPQAAGSYSIPEGQSTWKWAIRCATPEELRCISHMAIACGARGIMPYIYCTEHITDTYWEVGVVDNCYGHSTDWYDLDGLPGEEYVGWQSKYDEMKALNHRLVALGPKLIKLKSANVEPNFDISDQSGPVAENHYFMNLLDQDSMNDPDDQAQYFALVNRNCWPYEPDGATRYFDISTSESGTWILEDLATHEFFASNETGDFNDVPFEPGQGRVFRMAQTARWFGTTNMMLDVDMPAWLAVYVQPGTTINLGEEVTLTLGGTLAIEGGSTNLSTVNFETSSQIVVYGDLNIAPNANVEFGTQGSPCQIDVWHEFNIGSGADLAFGPDALVNVVWAQEPAAIGFLNISAGANLKFGQDAALQIFGQIEAYGNEQNPIVFQPINFQTSWDGIDLKPNFGSWQANLYYCRISGAHTGIKIDRRNIVFIVNGTIISNGVGIHYVHGSDPTLIYIEGNEIYGNTTYGIAIENQLIYEPDIELMANQIHDNERSGIALVNASPLLGNNWIGPNTENGIVLLGTSCPNLTTSPSIGGYNTIAGNYLHGLRVLDQSNPNLGVTSTFGHNNVYINSRYEIDNENRLLIYAQGNYWGTNDEREIRAGFYQWPYVSYAYWFPEFQIRGDNLGNPLEDPSALDDSTSIMGLICQAQGYLLTGNPAVAAGIFQQVISLVPGQPAALQALVGLYQAHCLLSSLPSYLNQLNNFIAITPSVWLSEEATYLKTVVCRALGDPSTALEFATSLAQSATYPALTMLANYSVAMINKYDLGQLLIGDSLLQAFIEEYPDGDLSTLAQVQIGAILPPTTFGAGGEDNMASVSLPLSYSLHQAFPNPFNAITNIRFNLPAVAFVKLTVYDVAGRLVADLVRGWREAGSHEVTFDASGLSAGIYLARLQAGDFSAVQKMVLLK